MSRFVDTVQKRIGLLVSIIGIAVISANIFALLHRREVSITEMLGNIVVWLLFITVVPFIVSVFVEGRLLKILQIAVFFFTGAVNLLNAGYEQFYGPAMFLSGWLLMRHYGFLETYPKTKNASVIIMVVLFSQISAILHRTGEGVYAGLMTLAFFLFLIIFILILWWDMMAQHRLLKEQNIRLQMDYNKLSEKIAEIEETKEPFDLKAAGITPAEKRVIRVLTLYKASNREIAERLNIAESTVKLHLYNIYNKIGVDNRFSIIDLCKYNFPD